MYKSRHIFAALALMLFAGVAFGKGATEAWVMNYVSNTIAQASTSYSNGVYTVSANGATITMEDATVTAVIVRSPSNAAVNAGFTDGLTLVWDSAPFAYVAGELSMPCTPSNITCTVGGVTYCSKSISRQTWLVPQSKYAQATFSAEDKLLRLVRTLLQPSVAEKVKQGE